MRDAARSSGLAAAVIAALHSTVAAAADAPPQRLPKISVGEDIVDESYKAQSASSPQYTQPLLDTPQTITVIPAAVIREQGATTLRDVLRNSPGITFQAGEGGALPGDQNFSLRGFSSRNSLYIDGVRDSGAYARDSFNLQQVEVIKGPTGAIAGRSATSGAVNQISKTPHAGDAQHYSLGLGSDDYRRVTSDINVGLGASSALRLNAMYHDAEASNRDVVEHKRFGVAPSLALGLGSATRFTLGLFYLEEDNVPDYGLPWGTLTQTTAADPSHNGVFPTGAYEANPPVDQSIFFGLKDYDFEDIRSEAAAAQLDHEFSDSVSLRNVLRYLDTDRSSAITSPRPPSRNLQRRDIDAQNLTNLTDLKIAFSTGSLQHTVAAGVELSRETTDNRNSSQNTNQPQIADFFRPDPNQRPLAAMPPNTGNPTETRVETIAVYASDTVALNEQWQVSAGVRRDDADVEFTTHDYVSGALLTDLERSEGELTWRAAVIFKPVEAGTLYAAYGTGFDPTFDAGAAGLGLSTTPSSANYVNLEPEESANLEFGVKWELFERRLALNAAVFETEKTNVRTRSGASNTESFVLDGEQRVRGVEVSAAGALTNAWSLFAGVSYLDSEYTQSLNSLERGEELLLTPDVSATLWTTYALANGVTVGLGAQYVDEIVRTRTVALGEAAVSDYVLLDGMVSWQATDSIALRLNATNLADEEYVDRFGGGHYVPGPGRTFSLTANFSY